jgi:hypothetical protein
MKILWKTQTDVDDGCGDAEVGIRYAKEAIEEEERLSLKNAIDDTRE